MRKETIIEIILSTMEEMRKLTETFADKENIPQPFIDLLMTKYSTLGKEIQLLEFWKEEETKKETAVEAEKEREAESVNEAETLVIPEITVEPVVQTEEKKEPVEEKEAEPVKEIEIAPVEIKAEEKREPLKPVEELKPIAPAKPVVPVNKVKTVSSKDTIEYGTPVSDIRKAVGINDRFLFQRELFGGDATRLNQTLDAINACTSYEEAHAMLQVFGWDETDANVEGFLKAVHRRFL